MPPDVLDLSLNEVETLAAKAARGAGLNWGAAEDTGRAAAWLALHLGTWAESLAALLEAAPPAGESPLLLAGPLADGAMASLARVVAPVWIAPLALLASGRCNPVALRLGVVELRCNPGDAVTASVLPGDLSGLPPGEVALRRAMERLAPLPHEVPARFRRSAVDAAALARLEALAARTYVPASDASRLRGAGAGLLDDE